MFLVFFRFFLLSHYVLKCSAYEMHSDHISLLHPTNCCMLRFSIPFYATNKHLTYFFEFHTEIWMCQVLFTYSLLSVSLSFGLDHGCNRADAFYNPKQLPLHHKTLNLHPVETSLHSAKTLIFSIKESTNNISLIGNLAGLRIGLVRCREMTALSKPPFIDFLNHSQNCSCCNVCHICDRLLSSTSSNENIRPLKEMKFAK